MTLEEKKERLIQLEWKQFQQVQNEGGRADCQDDPETFFIMRRSQFFAWPEQLVDSYTNDLENAGAMGRNLLAEKYAWMMETTAPEAFLRIRHLLPEMSAVSLHMIDEAAEQQICWMEEYRKRYPYLGAGNRITRASEARPGETAFETYLRGELHTYSENTLLLYREMLRDLAEKGENLGLIIMTQTVKAYGYRDLEDAEAHEKERLHGNR